MTFKFIYEPSEYHRIIPAVLIDARASIPAIANQDGWTIRSYADAESAKVDANLKILFFRIETTIEKLDNSEGVLAGYFSLSAIGKPRLYQFQTRPNFYQYNTQISAEISNFISSGQFRQYLL